MHWRLTGASNKSKRREGAHAMRLTRVSLVTDEEHHTQKNSLKKTEFQY